MPAKYDALKEKFMKEGMSEKDAETKAAKIYNGTRKKGQPTLFDWIQKHEK